MRSIHKLTHRPIARRLLMVTLFVLLGVAGWQLPRVGRAVLAYSNQAVTAARTSLTSTVPETKVAAAAGRVLNALAAAQQTPGQQALSQRTAELDAAIAAARSNPQGKASERAVQTARANYNAAVALRLSEIKQRLNALNTKKEAGKTSGDGGTAEALGAEYDALTAELRSLGGFPNVVEAPAPNQITETEPNNTPATANTLNVASGALAIAAGAITPAGDEDFYKFTAPANSKVWIYVDTGGTATGQERDTQVDLFNTNGTTLIENDDDDGTANGLDGTVESGLASAIAGRSLTAAGDYFIKVRDFDGTLTVNPYKLYVVVTTAATPVVAEVEPNDTGATANVLLTAAQTTAIATGNAASGADFYSIVVNAGDILYANLDGDPERDGVGTDAALSLRDAAGTTIIVTSDSINSGSAADPPAENFGFLFTTSGTFTLRVFSFGGQGTYNLMAKLVTPAAVQVCPPSPITSSLGVAGGNFAKVSGTQTQRLFRDGVVSACGVARTQSAPVAGTFTFDKYTFTNSGAVTACITINLTVVEQTASNYMVGAFSTFVPTNLTSGWLGDPGLSSGIPPTVQSFGVNIAAGASFDVVVFNTNATGDGGAYQLNVFGLPGCTVPPCGITCPANITVSNAANQCGATVTYPAPTTTGVCNTVTCVPASGSFFQKGTTTVTCTSTGNSNGTQTCSFTVTVNDTQPPAITCPANISVGTLGTTSVVTYAAPTVSDNCPGLQATVCVPASGSAFPLGTTTVVCTVKDAVNNSATCSFAVTVNKVTAPSLSDPLACTGPGNTVNGSFSVTNNGGAAQTVVATVVLGPAATANTPQGLLALTCTVSGSGTCTIGAGGTTVNYTATLAAGASATISYVLQVNDGVLPGTVLTSTVTASFNGGPPLTAGASLTASCQAPGPGPFYPARSEVTDQKQGSVLVYPIYTSSVGANSQNSRISITNTHLNLDVSVHLFFVSDSCAVSDAFICLTPNQTTTFLASDLDPGTTGYLVAVATNGVTGCPINFNYLVGDEYVKFTTGHAANLGAEAISAIAGSAFFASCNNNSVSATLAFDGVSYNRLPYVLAVDNIGSRADGNDTILIVDRIGGDLRTGPSGVGNIFGVFYNDSEALLSFTLSSTSCQYRFTVNNTVPRTTPRFEQFITAGRTGWMKLWQRDGNALLGAVINFNANAGTATGAFNQGHNLHVLTLTDTASYIVPVFPPGC